MKFRLLKESDMNSLYEAFIIAFSANNVRFKPTYEEFEHRMKNKLLLDYSISAGAFDNEKLIGFILHTKGKIEKEIIAYNGGTGVLPEWRNQQVGERMYGFLLPKLTEYKVKKVYLEVVSDNLSAIRLYEKIGYEFTRETKCYKQTKPQEIAVTHDIQEYDIRLIQKSFTDFEPSFIDSFFHLKRTNETVLTAKNGSECIGYLIFQPKMGRISQITVLPNFRRKGIGSQLIQSAQKYTSKPLTIMNIPTQETEMNDFLVSQGFENQVNQCEMLMSL